MFRNPTYEASKAHNNLLDIYRSCNRVEDAQSVQRGRQIYLAYAPSTLSFADKVERVRLLLAEDGDDSATHHFIRVCAGLTKPQAGPRLELFEKEGKQIRAHAHAQMQNELARADITSTEAKPIWSLDAVPRILARKEKALSYARVAFDVSSERFTQARTRCLAAQNHEMPAPAEEVVDLPAIENPRARLSAMVGLDSVKRQVSELMDTIQHQSFLQNPGRENQPLDQCLHLFFAGNPGTGKTEVARLFGSLLREAGILQRGHVVTASRAELLGTHVGETPGKTLALLNRADQGVLFIDEAHQLLPQDGYDFVREAISVLVPQMLERRNHLVVIFASYPDRREAILNLDPGLSRRVPNTIAFPDYADLDLAEIFRRMAAAKGYACQTGVAAYVGREVGRHRGRENYGNAGLVKNVLDQASRKLAVRRSAQMRNVANRIAEPADRLLTRGDVEGALADDAFLSRGFRPSRPPIEKQPANTSPQPEATATASRAFPAAFFWRVRLKGYLRAAQVRSRAFGVWVTSPFIAIFRQLATGVRLRRP